jgi:hypothetical protein
MSDTTRESILTSEHGTITVRQDLATDRTYICVDDDFTASTEICLTLTQHEQLLETLRQFLPEWRKHAEVTALVRDAYQHWQNIGWPTDKESIGKLKKALVLLEGGS